MKIIKRNGAEVTFDINKIEMAITKANEAAEEKYRMTPPADPPHHRIRPHQLRGNGQKPLCGGNSGSR